MDANNLIVNIQYYYAYYSFNLIPWGGAVTVIGGEYSNVLHLLHRKRNWGGHQGQETLQAPAAAEQKYDDNA